jgi:hypothetical protein
MVSTRWSVACHKATHLNRERVCIALRGMAVDDVDN